MSTKASTPQGRRTPLSLTGAMSKGQPNKGAGNTVSSGSNANGHTASNSNKQDNKLQQKVEQQKINNSDIKENPNNSKKVQQQQQVDKKQQQQNDNVKKSIEKNQNGVSSKQQSNEKQHQQQNKDKQQNGNEKLNENDEKEKIEKYEKQRDKLETKAKEEKKSEPEKHENKKEENKTKELKEIKEGKKVDTNEADTNIDEKSQNQFQVKNDNKKLKEEKDIKNVAQNPEQEKIESLEISEEQLSQQKLPPATPKTNKVNKTSTALSKTPTEKISKISTPSNAAMKTTPTLKREVTTTIDDVEMEPLTTESSPVKSTQPEVVNINITPTATSTPGKIMLPKFDLSVTKSGVQLAMQAGLPSERPRAFSQISGRKSIRPIAEYAPYKFQSNQQFRESYRRINTELDVTNTSMNVTVGSEVANNLSFSFLGRGRKRDRTPPQHSQSAIGELHTEMEVSPFKKARLEGFFSVVSSPLTLLRNRFSKTTLQSSTPIKLQQKLKDEIEVQNVSGVSIHEDPSKTDKEMEFDAGLNNVGTFCEEVKGTKSNRGLEINEFKDVSLKCEKTCGMEQTCEQSSDIKITETCLQPAVGDPLARNKRCFVM